MYEVTKEFNEYKVGDGVSFKDSIAKDLIKEGYIKTQTQDIKAEKVITKERKFKK
jgi:hypothetical protein